MFLTDVFKFRKTIRLSAETRTYTVTANPTQLRRNRVINALRYQGAITGRSVNLRRANRIAAGVASLAISPVASRVLYNRLITAEPTSLTMTDRSVFMQKTRVAGFVLTNYNITGQEVQLKRSLKLTANPASMAVTPRSVVMSRMLGTIGALPAGFVIDGQAALLKAARRVTAAPASLITQGQAAFLSRNYPILVTPQSYVLSTPALNLLMSRRLSVVKADWAIAGQSAGLTYTPLTINFTYISTSSGNAATKLLPSGAQAGDFVVLYDTAANTSGYPTINGPSGWSRFSSGQGGTRFVGAMSVRILTSGDVSTGSVTSMSGNAGNRYAMALFRPSRALTSFTVNDAKFSGSINDPPAITTAAGSASSTPVIVLGMQYADGSFTATETPNMTDLTTTSANHKCFYTIYNTSPANQTIDMPDTFGDNLQGLAYITFT